VLVFLVGRRLQFFFFFEKWVVGQGVL